MVNVGKYILYMDPMNICINMYKTRLPSDSNYQYLQPMAQYHGMAILRFGDLFDPF